MIYLNLIVFLVLFVVFMIIFMSIIEGIIRTKENERIVYKMSKVETLTKKLKNNKKDDKKTQ
tara:strand:- start:1140 stop:1325 length:186 start_codon:yes stop_codon:yes gene_type:complete